MTHLQFGPMTLKKSRNSCHTLCLASTKSSFLSSFKSRIDFKILLITYKALNNQAPTYIKELLSIKKPTSYNLRSHSDPCLLERPRLKTLKTLGDRSFPLAAPTLWNALPKVIRIASSTATFKKLLKTFLFLEAFN